MENETEILKKARELGDKSRQTFAIPDDYFSPRVNRKKKPRRKTIAKREPPDSTRVKAIIAACLAFFDYEKIEDVSIRSRKQPLPWVRQVIMYFLTAKTMLNYSQIGRLLNLSDHSSVMHGLGVVADMCETDPILASQVEKVGETINEILKVIEQNSLQNQQ